MEYYFIGDPELKTAFALVGVGGAAVSNETDAREAFQAVTEGNACPGCRVLILTEEAADWVGDGLTNWQMSGKYPLVVEVPGIMGRLPGRKTLVDNIREAIGVHV
jgi:V/A-type H+-transporting ATPase subunit F